MTQALEILEIPLFASLSARVRAEVLSTSELRDYHAGDVILEAGDTGRWLYAIAAGAVSVHPTPSQRELDIVLGAGEVFGEMALLSRTPVSARVTALRESRIYLVAAQTFDRLFAEESAFRQRIADLLAERLRARTSHQDRRPICALIGLPSSTSQLPTALAFGIDQYAPVFKGRCFEAGAQDIAALEKDILSWRASARSGEVYLAAVPGLSLCELRTHLRVGDAVLLVDDGSALPDSLALAALPGIDVAMVRIGAAASRPGNASDAWSFCVAQAEIGVARTATRWDARATPVIDAMARWITRRTIGIALGAGAARGFSHIGVLGVLDRAGVPIDCLSGSSMGGVVALLYSTDKSTNAADAVARITLQASEMIRETTLFRTSALSRGRKLRRAAERFLAGKYLSDLVRPVFTISADLITGQRIVLDRGLVATALMATSAIPGALSPVRTAEHWLVDGALFSRVPVDLLGRWRCGLKIAVGVEGRLDAEGEEDRAELRRAMSGPFGLPRVIARSWDLLGISQGTAEVQTADIIITPDTRALSGFNFKDIRSFIAAGTLAANRELPKITEAVQKLLQPRVR